MSWEVVVGIITLFGFLVAVITPIVKLTRAITDLTHTCKDLTESFDKSEKHNKESHAKIWDHNEIQDKQIRNHELRLHDLDGKWFDEL